MAKCQCLMRNFLLGHFPSDNHSQMLFAESLRTKKIPHLNFQGIFLAGKTPSTRNNGGKTLPLHCGLNLGQISHEAQSRLPFICHYIRKCLVPEAQPDEKDAFFPSWWASQRQLWMIECWPKWAWFSRLFFHFRNDGNQNIMIGTCLSDHALQPLIPELLS